MTFGYTCIKINRKVSKNWWKRYFWKDNWWLIWFWRRIFDYLLSENSCISVNIHLTELCLSLYSRWMIQNTEFSKTANFRYITTSISNLSCTISWIQVKVVLLNFKQNQKYIFYFCIMFSFLFIVTYCLLDALGLM